MLLPIRKNAPFKMRNKNEWLLRDKCFLSFSEEGTWKISLNSFEKKGKGWIELRTLFKEISKEIQSKNKGNQLKKLVVWVNQLPLFWKVIQVCFPQDKFFFDEYEGFKGRVLFSITSSLYDFRNFDTIAGQPAKKIGQLYEFGGDETDIMKQYFEFKQYENWAKVCWSAGRMYEKEFEQSVEKNATKDELRLLHYEIKVRAKVGNNLLNTYIYRSGKGGLIGFDKKIQNKVIHNVYSFDINQAYGAQFVRANDFPLGEVHLSMRPLAEVLQQDWFYLVFEWDYEIRPPFSCYTVFKENDKWLLGLEKADLDCLKIAGYKLPKGWKIHAQFVCNKIGYLNNAIRKEINNMYLKRKTDESLTSGEKDILKQKGEVIYGKGLQMRETKFKYFCPQISYHALAKTRLEIIMMIARLGSVVAWDSDCIKTQNPQAKAIFEQRNNEINKENMEAGFENTIIGLWKDEAKGGCFESFIQFKKKVYAYELKGKLICKFAGCNSEQLEQWIIDAEPSIYDLKSVPAGMLVKECWIYENGDFWIHTQFSDYSLEENFIKKGVI